MYTIWVFKTDTGDDSGGSYSKIIAVGKFMKDQKMLLIGQLPIDMKTMPIQEFNEYQVIRSRFLNEAFKGQFCFGLNFHVNNY